LSPFNVKFYERLGWELWRGPLFIRTEKGLIPSPTDEEVMIFRLPETPDLDLTAPLSVEWREGEAW
jgi:aminoglycoside 2'-N-acetyltransferase I